MRKLLILLVVVASLIAVLGVVSAQDEGSAECSLPFEATVLSGPDAELALIGDLTLVVDATGGAEGTLVTADDSEFSVVGQINGRSINLAFDLGDDVYIFGLGTAFEPIGAGNCGLALGGPFVGPAPDDTGTWLAGTALKLEDE
jgi:hypothetical protein